MPWPWIIGGAVVAGKLAYDWITRDDDDDDDDDDAAEAARAAYQREEQARREQERQLALARSLVERYKLNVEPEVLLALAAAEPEELRALAAGELDDDMEDGELAEARMLKALKKILHEGGMGAPDLEAGEEDGESTEARRRAVLKKVLREGGAWKPLERELEQARARVRELERLQRRLAAED